MKLNKFNIMTLGLHPQLEEFQSQDDPSERHNQIGNE